MTKEELAEQIYESLEPQYMAPSTRSLVRSAIARALESRDAEVQALEKVAEAARALRAASYERGPWGDGNACADIESWKPMIDALAELERILGEKK